MRVKTFRGESMQAVLAQVRQELGPEAVILGSQTIRENGTALCELMAALEQPATPEPVHQGGQASAFPGLIDRPAPARRTPAGPGGDWNREWDEIKGHLLALLRPRMDFDSLAPRQRLALEFLEREGVEEAAILALFRSILEGGEDTVIPALARMLRVKPLTPQTWPGMSHLFFGPSGVGKTTTLLRLALTARSQAPGQRVRVANADGGRGKGRLMLRHFAELSGLVYAEVAGPSDFDELITAAAAGDAVFVDTPSFRREGEAQAWCQDMGLTGRTGLAGHLVLSPLFSPAQTAHFLRAHRCEHLSSCVWTKLDEACSYGSLVNVAHASSLPVSALTFGPELTQGMAPASAKAVWKLLFKHQLPGEYPDTTDAGV
jgi:flagellar biosynthesis protein FlhF